jgi:uncharacterized ion transporter superfamily protein YfcC
MKIRLISATVMLVAAAAGCMTSTRIDPGVAWVNPGEHRIVQTAAGFKTSRQRESRLSVYVCALLQHEQWRQT